jgi:3-(3-hydroxy-phenyl)propionate hydroxylase
VVIAREDPQMDDRVGRMFIQPKVEVERGVVKPLDDVLGSGFSLLCWQEDRASQIPPSLSRQLEQLGCSVVVAARSKSLQGMQLRAAARGGVSLVEDFENALHFWFGKTGADWVLIRPDRYVATLGKSDELTDVLTQFLKAFTPEASI